MSHLEAAVPELDSLLPSRANGQLRASLRPAVRTEVPGPRSRVLLDRQGLRESAARSYPRRLPIAVARAAGSFIEDADGNVFVDFLTGAGALPLGHSDREIVAEVRRQLEIFVHGLDFPSPAKDLFTERQLSMLPAAMRDRTRLHFAGPTGANAVDAAIKLCKTATGRESIVSFTGGFHGATAAAMAVSGSVSQKAPVPAGLPGVHFMPYPYCLRCPLGLSPAGCGTSCATLLERSLRDPLGGITRPAAVIVELVQGEGGVIPAPADFVKRLRDLTRELEIPLIVDEVQTGCGRTGTWFAFEQYGIEPDVIVASKGLSGLGLPVALVLYDERLDRWQPGAHTGTFRGNQLAFAGGAKMIEIFGRDHILANVLARGEQLMAGLRGLASSFPVIADVRGRGLMLGIELADPRTGEPSGEAARRVQQGCLRRGLILEVGGRADSVVRLLPPLNVSAGVVTAALDVLTEAVSGDA
ncbi:MAG TPA: diaminobutyrate--2-oxoglutarate transaminase family protein [Streptosporangiaceae bacterium]|nr:diaminobutyrate--2-oxoglutarate transaminase family protein [Streptosporangiaceae bacterium]